MTNKKRAFTDERCDKDPFDPWLERGNVDLGGEVAAKDSPASDNLDRGVPPCFRELQLPRRLNGYPIRQSER